MQRCRYSHPKFNNSRGYRFDGSGLCWVNEHVAPLDVNGKREWRCILHMPDDYMPHTEVMSNPVWNFLSRGIAQAELLKKLLDKWNEENKNKKTKEELLSFILPDIRCGEITLEYSVTHKFLGDIDLSGSIFSGNIRLNNIWFLKPVSFESAEFKKDLSFEGVNFYGAAKFLSSSFYGNTDFQQMHFHKFVLFRSARFEKRLRFIQVQFDNVLYLDSAEFYGDAEFNTLIANDNLHLSNNIFKRGGRFLECKFYIFEYKTHQGEKLLFNKCKYVDGGRQFHFIDQDCSKLAFLNTDLSKAWFLGADIANTRFDSCTWERPKKPPYYYQVYQHNDMIAEKNNNEQLILLKSLYRQLKKNLEDSKEYKQAGDFHYREMEVRQMLEKMGGGGLEHRLLQLYRFIADYGESYKKLFFTLITTFIFSTFLVAVSNATDRFGGFSPLLKKIGLILSTKIELQTIENTKILIYEAFQNVIFGVIPSAFRGSAVESGLNFFSKMTIVLETLVALVLSTLFVMAIRRRFRR